MDIGLIGIGSMGENHVRVCSELENINLIGVSDIDKNKVKSISKKFNVQPFFDYKKLIKKVDAAIIATPTITHSKIATDFLKNEKHVLVEKPLCNDVKKAKELIKLSEKNNLTLAVGHIERHNPAVAFVKNALNKKRFGKLITLNSKRVSNFPGRIRDVGVIFDFGIHDIDVMRYLAGEVISVYATAGRFNKNIKFEDYANIVLKFSNGLTGVLENNWLTPMKIRRLSLTCSENFVDVDYIKQSVLISSSSFKNIQKGNLYNIPIQYNTDQVLLQKKEPLKNEISDFIQAISKNRKPLADGYDGLKAIEIAQASLESYKKNKIVKIGGN
jgi:UDP-N-acetylglucosamine 3-dehydrogenase